MKPIFDDEMVSYRCNVCYAILSPPADPAAENVEVNCPRCTAEVAEDPDGKALTPREAER